VPDVKLVAADAVATSTGDGQFDLGVVAPGTAVEATAPGYAPVTADSGSGATMVITLRPTSVHGRVTDAKTGKPLYGVIVRIDLPAGSAAPAATGTAAPAVTATLTVTPGAQLPVLYGSFTALRAAQVLTDTTPAPAVPTATEPPPPSPTPTPPPPMPTPFVNDKMILAVTDADGRYTLDNVPLSPTLTLKMPGYKLTKVPLTHATSQDVALEPFVVKALYMTAFGVSAPVLYDPIMDLADNTEINAVVLNIQDDSARVVYDTKVQMAIDSGAVDKSILPNIKDLIADFHKRDLYVIARMVTFMQPAVADANPALAVRSKATGKPWIGGELSQQRWLDPTNPRAREYPLALAYEATTLGFDEIQFDYIRFPSDPAEGEKFENLSYSQPADNKTKPQYIAQFMTEAHNMLNTTDAFMSVDVFGYTVWPDQNGQPLNAVIGQVFEPIIGHTDYICPMIYPSHFSAGELGFSDPNAHPYEIIKRAGEYTQERIAGQRAKYRPWLQGFDWTHLAYDGRLYRLQIQAAAETGAAGWMFWDPSNVYSGDGFNPEH
ncbi:MAG TPA: putative glycoside hydrolase, partial [Chloroflexia bacterium]|nr:putative glycoside hydrolase [Chloroflexia bacterium]